MPGFYRLERQYIEEKISSIHAAIDREIYHLGQLSEDWSAWDDMYRFVQKPSEEFIFSNFQWESLSASGIDLVNIYI